MSISVWQISVLMIAVIVFVLYELLLCKHHSSQKEKETIKYKIKPPRIPRAR